MIIQQNLLAVNANRQFGIVNKKQLKTTDKLSSGYRINKAADDAAGLVISENMRSQIRGLNQASTNVQDGISMCQVADGALNEVQDMLHRISELSVQAANDINTEDDREATQGEVTQLLEEINRVADMTEFNTQKLFTSNTKPVVSVEDNSIAVPAVTILGFSDVNITEANKDNLPFRYSSNNKLQMYADEEGVWFTSPSMYTNDVVLYSKMSWEDMGATKWGEPNEFPGDTECTYTDSVTGLEMKFTIANASTKEAVISGLNGVDVMADFSTPAKVKCLGYTYNGYHTIVNMTGTSNLTPIGMYDIGTNFNETSGYIESDRPERATDYYQMVLGRVGFRSDVSETSILASVNNNIDKYLAGEIGNLATNSMTFFNSDGRGSIQVRYTYDLSYFDTLTDSDGNRREPTDTERNNFIYNGITRPLNNWYVLEVDAGGQSTVNFTAAANGADTGNTNSKLVTYSYEKAKRNVHIQSGYKDKQSILLQFDVINTGALGINNISVLSEEKAGHAITASQKALEKISESRSKIGAYQNQLEHAYNISLNTAENTEYSESRIRDADIADEIVEYSKNQILLQVGQAVIAQSNQSKEGIIMLLE